MAGHPNKYAQLLEDKLKRHNVRVWLINTGWSGGPYGVGQRIGLAHTRAILDVIHGGTLATAPTQRDPLFGFEVVTSCAGVPGEILWPRDTWADRAAYDAAAKKLAGLFRDNFTLYQSGVEGGP